MTAMTPEQARDTAAIAAYGAWTGEGLERVLSDWALLPPAGRADWRAVADAVRMTVEAQSLDQTQQPQPAPELAAAMAEKPSRAAGQAVREAFLTWQALPPSEMPAESWDQLPSWLRKKWESIAQAAMAAYHDQLRDRLATLAASLDADALATQPSKKSQIQADAARRIREALA